MKPKTMDVSRWTPERVYKWIDPSVGNDACWEWKGAHKKPQGYGIVSAGGRQLKAHRLVYAVLVGPVSNDVYVCHSCDNPPCCNPAHLYLGTQSNNMIDRRERGRDNSRKGEAHHKAKLTDADILAIRAEWNATARHYGLLQRLSRQYDVHPDTISRVVHRKGWDHL